MRPLARAWNWAMVFPQSFRVLQLDGQLHPLLGKISAP
jgi:hypothetical protein